jgi:hypothetical protein
VVSLNFPKSKFLPDLSLFKSKSKSKLYYDRQSVGQSVLLSGTHLGTATNFSQYLFDYFFDSFGFVDEKSGLYFSVFADIAIAACLRSESHGTHEHSLLFLFLGLPQLGGPGSCIYFPPGTG